MSGRSFQDFSLPVNSLTGNARILNLRIAVSEAPPLFLSLGRGKFSEARSVNQLLQISRHNISSFVRFHHDTQRRSVLCLQFLASIFGAFCCWMNEQPPRLRCGQNHPLKVARIAASQRASGIGWAQKWAQSRAVFDRGICGHPCNCLEWTRLGGAPGLIRTGDLLLRRQTLYPAELRVHVNPILSHRCSGVFPDSHARIFKVVGLAHQVVAGLSIAIVERWLSGRKQRFAKPS